jgi:hypothetical protein
MQLPRHPSGKNALTPTLQVAYLPSIHGEHIQDHALTGRQARPAGTSRHGNARPCAHRAYKTPEPTVPAGWACTASTRASLAEETHGTQDCSGVGGAWVGGGKWVRNRQGRQCQTPEPHSIDFKFNVKLKLHK